MSQLELTLMFVKIAIVLAGLLATVPIMLFVERRGSALMQNRLGPNRMGPFGLFQAACDVLKFIFKEDRAPAHVDRFYYTIAPWIAVIPAFMTFAVIPFAGSLVIDGTETFFQIANLDVGVLYCFSIASLGVYGIIMAGWASNNHYSLLGSLRSSAQMISYELTLGLSIVGLMMVFQSIKLGDFAVAQGETLLEIGPLAIPKWGVFIQPVGFILFLVSVFAETNRLPFDLPEGESELIAGYHLEYGSMRFALFMMAEFINMAVASALITTLFFGGWQLLPGFGFLADQVAGLGLIENTGLVKVLFQGFSFVLKVAFWMWFFVWVRWTLPRFRFDQLMNFGWKVLFPIGLLNVLITGLLIYKGVL
ncbi:NADH-quinone oxidoreductase subunit NuoH [bacterium]|jgi:NADH-quinone oxidoreductase subunit H|nr:NADH-quinone oxidoreductase subunit NuoH [bacterium]